MKNAFHFLQRPAPRRLVMVLLAAASLITCGASGWNEAIKASAWSAFNRAEYSSALLIFEEMGDQTGRGMTLLALHRPDDALAAFTAGGDSKGRGLALLAKNQPTEALMIFDSCGDQSGRGLALLASHQSKAAKEAFAAANDWKGMGLVALEEKNPEEARACFQRIGDQSGMGLAWLQEQKFEEAGKAFTTAKDSSGLILLALATGQLDEAERLAKESNDLSKLGTCQLERREFDAALASYTGANDWNGIGDVYSASRRFAEAREAFEKANSPVKVVQSYRNDWTLGEEGRHGQAIAYGLKAAADGRMPAECLCEVADAQYHAGQPQEALKTLERAAQYSGYASEAALRRGRILFYLRDYEAAKAAFSSVKAGEVGTIAWQAVGESLETLERYHNLNLSSARSF